ncbi:hypothetical protein LTR62_002711 [Meristemomyces frigidus]|uniref:Uncharacterized protein n=1 Tax=Meristemomyces frigidus TaxID=1508187 RepID=A0AAN7TGL4_9PEZI|nr:hypothetical protein LTR62_002711 [Meristemomyces frigidus]
MSQSASSLTTAVSPSIYYELSSKARQAIDFAIPSQHPVNEARSIVKDAFDLTVDRVIDNGEIKTSDHVLRKLRRLWKPSIPEPSPEAIMLSHITGILIEADADVYAVCQFSRDDFVRVSYELSFPVGGEEGLDRHSYWA